MARRTREQWWDLFKIQSESGLSAAQCCRRRGINPSYFFQRKAKLGQKSKPATDSGVGFVELRPPVPVGSVVEIHLGPVALSVPANTSPIWVASVMRELAGATV